MIITMTRGAPLSVIGDTVVLVGWLPQTREISGSSSELFAFMIMICESAGNTLHFIFANLSV